MQSITSRIPSPTKRVKDADDGHGSKSKTFNVTIVDGERGILSTLDVRQETLACQIYNRVAKTMGHKEGEQKKKN